MFREFEDSDNGNEAKRKAGKKEKVKVEVGSTSECFLWTRGLGIESFVFLSVFFLVMTDRGFYVLRLLILRSRLSSRTNLALSSTLDQTRYGWHYDRFHPQPFNERGAHSTYTRLLQGLEAMACSPKSRDNLTDLAFLCTD